MAIFFSCGQQKYDSVKIPSFKSGIKKDFFIISIQICDTQNFALNVVKSKSRQDKTKQDHAQIQIFFYK